MRLYFKYDDNLIFIVIEIWERKVKKIKQLRRRRNQKLRVHLLLNRISNQQKLNNKKLLKVINPQKK